MSPEIAYEWSDPDTGIVFRLIRPEKEDEPPELQRLSSEGWIISKMSCAAPSELARLVDALEEILLSAPALPEKDLGFSLEQRMSLTLLYAQEGNEYGVPALQNRIMDLEEELASVRDSYSRYVQAMTEGGTE